LALGIVDVSRRKPYKIAKWSVLALGCLFFVFGGIFLLVGAIGNTINPREIHLVASGVNAVTSGVRTGEYALNVSERETKVMVSTAPLGSGDRVTFSMPGGGTDAIRITNRPTSETNSRDLTARNRNNVNVNWIWPGDSFYITLVGDTETAFKFGQTVEVRIHSGAQTVSLNVTLVLPPHQVEWDFHIREIGPFGRRIESIRAQDYFDGVYCPSIGWPGGIPEHSPYTFSVTLRIWGSVLPAEINISPSGAEDNNGNRVIEGDTEIRLFGIPSTAVGASDGFGNIYIPQEWVTRLDAPPYLPVGMPTRFHFDITATTEHSGKLLARFTLQIV